jgi:hypothetical protein
VKRGEDLGLSRPDANQQQTYKSSKVLAGRLEALAVQFRRWTGDGKSDLELYTRLKSYSVNYDFAGQLEVVAERLRSTAKAAHPRSVARVKRRELRRLKGLSLHLLDRVVGAFEDAHERDAKVPRLPPIATRDVLAF